MSAAKRAPGPWRVQRVVVPFPREVFDPARPFELSRTVGRYCERMKDESGKVVAFATEDEARAAIARGVS